MGDLKLLFRSYLFTGNKYAEFEVFFPTNKGNLRLIYEFLRSGEEVSQLFLDGKPLNAFPIKNFPRFVFNVVTLLRRKFGDKIKESKHIGDSVITSTAVVKDVEIPYEEALEILEKANS